MNVSIFGLGYVGAVSSACLARQGHRVIGVDVNTSKVELINNKTSPIVEHDLDEYISEAVESGCLSATTDSAKAISESDISIICVGTPSLLSGNINLGYVFNVIEEIGRLLRDKDSFHSVVIRSTITPGTIKECGEILEDISGKKLNKDFGIASNPEFLREGTALFDFFNPPYTIIGSSCSKTEDQLKELYKGIEAPVYCLKPEESEMIKYANNNFHALKITFANEIGNICKELGVDSHTVMKIVTEDKKLNLSPYYMKPGFAFGGSCLPKDVRGLTYTAKHMDLKTPLLQSLLDSNSYQVDRALQLIKKSGKKKIGFLGFSFKEGTDDLRESPVLTLIENLIGKGFELSLFDTNVNLSRLTGKNKEYLNSHMPHISRLLKSDMNHVITSSEVIVVGTKESAFRQVFDLVHKKQIIIDLVRLDDKKVSQDNYVGICW